MDDVSIDGQTARLSITEWPISLHDRGGGRAPTRRARAEHLQSDGSINISRGDIRAPIIVKA